MKLFLSNSIILLFIIIIIGIYFYKGIKEGYSPLPPPLFVRACGMMTSYGEQNCNKTITIANQKCIWNNSINNNYGGVCQGIY